MVAGPAPSSAHSDMHRRETADSAGLPEAGSFNCELWAVDKKLYRAVHNKLAWVRTIPEIDPSEA